jgi:hypothetical protein
MAMPPITIAATSEANLCVIPHPAEQMACHPRRRESVVIRRERADPGATTSDFFRAPRICPQVRSRSG